MNQHTDYNVKHLGYIRWLNHQSDLLVAGLHHGLMHYAIPCVAGKQQPPAFSAEGKTWAAGSGLAPFLAPIFESWETITNHCWDPWFVMAFYNLYNVHRVKCVSSPVNA